MTYGSLFHIPGTETLKALLANVFLFVNGTIRQRSSLVLLSTHPKGGLRGIYLIHLNVINGSLNTIFDFTSNQCSEYLACTIKFSPI